MLGTGRQQAPCRHERRRSDPAHGQWRRTRPAAWRRAGTHRGSRSRPTGGKPARCADPHRMRSGRSVATSSPRAGHRLRLVELGDEWGRWCQRVITAGALTQTGLVTPVDGCDRQGLGDPGKLLGQLGSAVGDNPCAFRAVYPNAPSDATVSPGVGWALSSTQRIRPADHDWPGGMSALSPHLRILLLRSPLHARVSA